jgi:hypothetical protein
MTIVIECPITIKTSHKISQIGYSGTNRLDINANFAEVIHGPLNRQNTTMQIEKIDDSRFKFIITSSELIETEDQIEFVETLANLLSYYLNEKEMNPHCGTCYVDIDWDGFISHTKTGGLHLTDRLFTVMTRKVSLDFDKLKSVNEAVMYQFYYDGLRAEQAKSKFFCWFLILEKLENSEKYKELFDGELLFDEAEEAKIRNLAEDMPDSKRSLVLTLLKRTMKARQTKLYELLKNIGVDTYKFLNQETALTVTKVKEIIEARNSIFHQSTTFSQDLLWNHLFPIVRSVLQNLSVEPKLLQATKQRSCAVKPETP